MPTPVGAASNIQDIIAGSNANVDYGGLDPSLVQGQDEFGSKDTFLKLMVAQLKYQNPLEPMDSSAFMAQTAQFTSVEKLTELTNKLTESLVNDRMGTATGMIGRTVTFTGTDGGTTTAQVTGVKFSASGPLLVLADGSEVGMGQIESVAMPPAAPTTTT